MLSDSCGGVLSVVSSSETVGEAVVSATGSVVTAGGVSAVQEASRRRDASRNARGIKKRFLVYMAVSFLFFGCPRAGRGDGVISLFPDYLLCFEACLIHKFLLLVHFRTLKVLIRGFGDFEKFLSILLYP